MNALAAVVLAAGAGRRFGGPKLLADLDGMSVLARTLARVASHPLDPIVLVTGAYAATVEREATDCARRGAFAARLRLVHADHAAEGMGASLRAGVAALYDDASRFTPAGVFIWLADMPCVPASVFASLCSALADGAEAAAPTWRGRRGHPVLFGPSVASTLTQTTGDEGARSLLADLGPRLALVAAETDGVVFDVDRPQDLDALRGRRAERGAWL